MRWLVVLLPLSWIACAQSTQPNLDEAASSELHCIAMREMVCDACDPYRTSEECDPEYIATLCPYEEWSCAPIPSIRQAGECRRAFAEEVRREGCVSSEYRDYPVPECTRFDACGI